MSNYTNTIYDTFEIDTDQSKTKTNMSISEKNNFIDEMQEKKSAQQLSIEFFHNSCLIRRIQQKEIYVSMD